MERHATRGCNDKIMRFMKRIFSIFAAALLAVGCSDSEALEGDVSATTGEPISFVLGDLGAISTKADADAGVLKSSWTEGDEVAILMEMSDDTVSNAYKYKVDSSNALVAAESAEFYAAGTVYRYCLYYPYIDNNSSSYTSLNDEFTFITKEQIVSTGTIGSDDKGTTVTFGTYILGCYGYIFDLDLTLNSSETFSSWSLTFTCGDGTQYNVKDTQGNTDMSAESVTLLTTQGLDEQDITQIDITIKTDSGKSYSYVDTTGLPAELAESGYNTYGELVKHTITIDQTDIIK